jgi:hypothetical protein
VELSAPMSAKPVLALNFSHSLLYSLIVRQLFDDGFTDLAKVVARSTNTSTYQRALRGDPRFCSSTSSAPVCLLSVV